MRKCEDSGRDVDIIYNREALHNNRKIYIFKSGMVSVAVYLPPLGWVRERRHVG